MGERFKKFSRYFGGEYMKYWYIAFAVTVLLMLAFSIADAKVDKFTSYEKSNFCMAFINPIAPIW